MTTRPTFATLEEFIARVRSEATEHDEFRREVFQQYLYAVKERNRHIIKNRNRRERIKKEEEASGVVPKKRGGRKPKTLTVETITFAEPRVKKEKPAPKPRGRPRKNPPVDSEIPASEVSGSVAGV